MLTNTILDAGKFVARLQKPYRGRRKKRGKGGEEQEEKKKGEKKYISSLQEMSLIRGFTDT
jgi:hypothetical protein